MPSSFNAIISAFKGLLVNSRKSHQDIPRRINLAAGPWQVFCAADLCQRLLSAARVLLGQQTDMRTYFSSKSSTGSKPAPAHREPHLELCHPLHAVRILKFPLSPCQQLLCAAWGYFWCSTTACPGHLTTPDCGRTAQFLQVTHILHAKPVVHPVVHPVTPPSQQDEWQPTRSVSITLLPSSLWGK